MDLTLEGIRDNIEGTKPTDPAKSFQRATEIHSGMRDWTTDDDGII